LASTVDRESKEISAFVTPDSLFQYKVMPFGMKNAPATFQRMIHPLLRGLQGCEAYIDDAIIYTWEEHLQIMCKFFDTLAKANLTVNLAKIYICHATVKYLSHKVGQGYATPIMAKVEAIYCKVHDSYEQERVNEISRNDWILQKILSQLLFHSNSTY
jgi:hypothetical protein